jgi:triosephosphate isomerase
MNGSRAANAKLIGDLVGLVSEADAEAVVCVPFVYLEQVGQLLKAASVSASVIKLGAQDVSLHVKGAYTGEISAVMLADVACDYVIVGHSERRE